MMKKLKDLNIGVKIGGGFAVLIMLSIVLVWLGYSSLSLVAHKAEISQEANNIGQLMLTMRVNQVKFMRSGNRDKAQEVNGILAQIEEESKLLKEKMELEKNEKKIEEINKVVDDFKVAFNNYAQTTYQQQNFRKNFVDKEREIIKPLDKLAKEQNQEVKSLIKNNGDTKIVVQKQNNISLIKEAIKYVKEVGEQERNLIINLANDQQQEFYINETNKRFKKASISLEKLKNTFNEEKDIKQVDQILNYLTIAKNSFDDIVSSEKTKDKQKNIMVELGDKVAASISQLATAKKEEIKTTISSRISNLVIILIFSVLIAVGFAIVVTKAITKPIKSMRGFLKELAQSGGDLTKKVQVDSNDEIGQLGYWFNRFIEQLHEIILEVKENSEDLSAQSEELSASAEEGNASIEESNELINEMAANIEQISAGAQEVSSYAQETSSQTEDGRENIENTIGSISQINQVVDKTVDAIDDLENNSEEIEKIVDLITDIAEQTNLLALNAAIEAARAGEHGKGFAVVADEIRGLAAETAQATENIAALIKKTQNNVGIGLKSIKEVDQKAKEGEKIANRTSEVFEIIAKASTETTGHVEETSSAAQELAEDTDQVMNAAQDIGTMSDEVAYSSQELADLAQELQGLVNQFTV